jgi:hypothetical protein
MLEMGVYIYILIFEDILGWMDGQMMDLNI